MKLKSLLLRDVAQTGHKDSSTTVTLLERNFTQTCWVTPSGQREGGAGADIGSSLPPALSGVPTVQGRGVRKEEGEKREMSRDC